jgi:hypothetical protein
MIAPIGKENFPPSTRRFLVAAKKYKTLFFDIDL